MLGQIYQVFRDSKWMIAITLLLCGALLLPNQVIELYRIAAIEGGIVALFMFGAVALIGLAIWLGAIQIAAQTQSSGSIADPCAAKLNNYLPVVLGTFPLLCAAIALFRSRPSLDKVSEEARQVGSVLRVQYDTLVVVKDTLLIYGFVFLAMACLIAAAMSMLNSRILAVSIKTNRVYFARRRFLAATAIITILLAVLFVRYPVGFASALGSFGVLALFTVCLTAVCVHLSLITIRDRIPYIPLILIGVLLISLFDLNDNHVIRTLPAKSPADGETSMPKRLNASAAFETWLAQRGLPIGGPYNKSPYPVFVVTAQGGGIYAAYNAAIFLARMQDLCPTFHHHLFAISGVSGGSIGASTFAAALDAAGKAGPQPGDVSPDPCPRMRRFLSNAHADNLDIIGNTEANVDLALSSDFLSPLLASTLFPDFMQSLIPRPVGSLDRARALEFTLESAAQQMYARKQSPIGSSDSKTVLTSGKPRNLLEDSFQAHWSPSGAIPALLLNATDSGSGKRIVMSPFDLDKAKSEVSDICVLAPAKRADDFALSTAAFISARFPWVTPAATTRLLDPNPCIADKLVKKIRLVDGGYIDNSGVETALDLVTEMKRAVRDKGGDTGGDPFPIYLISLSSGDFPSKRDYSMNELMEPIRALLNGREARAAIALNRARTESQIVKVSGQPELPRFNRTNLRSYFYDLPLGWAMSDKTRDIIALDSGRFWDCQPSTSFVQTNVNLSNADCVQLQIYHLLNGSATSALAGLEQANKIAVRMADLAKAEGDPPKRVDHENLLSCYERGWQDEKFREWEKVKGTTLTPYKKNYLSHNQAEHVRELLREWDRLNTLTDPSVLSGVKDPAVLAYVLGSLSYDSNDFRRLTENVTFKSASQIEASPWWSRIQRINKIRKDANPSAQDVDVSTLINKPEDLAELVWGWEKNIFGNNFQSGVYNSALKEGWKYRPRGVYQIIGREQYESEGRRLKLLNKELDDKFLLNEPDALWDKRISAKVAFAHFLNWRSSKVAQGTSDERAKKRRDAGLESKALPAVLAEHPDGFELARRNQHDMGDGKDEDIVSRQSKLFKTCIQQARIK